MASRLQADEANKEGKWADIDDDEDDWAPENVQWMDGTKSTLLAEKAPTPVKASQGQPPPKPEVEADQNPVIPPPQPPASLQSAGKTILRPGARNAVQMRPGLALKAVPEAPSPPVKHTPTSSNKSPWAPIPIIDKASPIVFEPPPPSRPSMTARYESSAIDDRPMPSPAKEIAADDFDRSWRDNDRGSQTLFNSQSGRYEPVRGARRSSRNDGGFRPPSLLQRPSEGQGSMEAFHSRDAQHQPWARRRESSSNDARPSTEQQDPAKAPTHPATTTSPSMDQKPSSSEEGKLPNPGDDPRLEQQRLMRERIELNRKRKQEEEAGEIAAKEERIRQKLAALAPPEKADVPTSSDDINLDNSTTTSSQALPPKASDVQPSQSLQELESPAAKPSLHPSSSLLSSQNQNQPRSPTKSPSAPLADTQPRPVSNTPPAAHNFTKAASDINTPITQSSDLTELPGLGPPPPTHHQKPPNFNRYQQNSWSNRSHPMATTVLSTLAHHGNIGNNAYGGEIHRSSATHLPHTQVTAASVSPALVSPHPTPSPPESGQAVSNFVHPSARGRPPPTGGRLNEHREQGRNQWQNFSVNVDDYDAVTREQTKINKDELDAKKWQDRLKARVLIGATMSAENTIKETYVATTSHGTANGRRTIGKQQLVHEGPPTPIEAAFGQVAPGFAPQHSQQALNSITNGSKTSRFFPPGAAPPLTPIARPVDLHEQFCFSDSSSPPPPEEGGHPAFERTNAQGSLTVRLPSAKPKPTVKLPPPPPATKIPEQQANVRMPVGQQPIANNEFWKQRFDGLFGRESSKSHTATSIKQAVESASHQAKLASAPITSYSKDALTGSPASTLATVSLPHKDALQQKIVPRSFLHISEPTTKPGVESLMDDREFGSSPAVKIPKGVQQRDSRVLEPSVAASTVGLHDDLKRVESKKEFTNTAGDLSFVYLDGIHLRSDKQDMRFLFPGSTKAFILTVHRSPAYINFTNKYKYNNNQSQKKHNATGKDRKANKSRQASVKVNGVETANVSRAPTKLAAVPKIDNTAGSGAAPQKHSPSSVQASERLTRRDNAGFAKVPRGDSRRAYFGKPLSAQRQLA